MTRSRCSGYGCSVGCGRRLSSAIPWSMASKNPRPSASVSHPGSLGGACEPVLPYPGQATCRNPHGTSFAAFRRSGTERRRTPWLFLAVSRASCPFRVADAYGNSHARRCVRDLICRKDFPMSSAPFAPPLAPRQHEADFPGAFVRGFSATMGLSDFPHPYVLAVVLLARIHSADRPMPLRTRCGTSRLDPCIRTLGVRAQGLGPRGRRTALAITICSVLPSEMRIRRRRPLPNFILPFAAQYPKPARLPVNAVRLCSLREQQRMTRAPSNSRIPWFANSFIRRDLHPRGTYRFVPAHFAVGTALTGGPPHRSQRALLTHWSTLLRLSASWHDAQASLFGIRVQCCRCLDDFHQPFRGRWHRRIHGCRVEGRSSSANFLVNRAPLSRQATCRIRSSALCRSGDRT